MLRSLEDLFEEARVNTESIRLTFLADGSGWTNVKTWSSFLLLFLKDSREQRVAVAHRLRQLCATFRSGRLTLAETEERTKLTGRKRLRGRPVYICCGGRFLLNNKKSEATVRAAMEAMIADVGASPSEVTDGLLDKELLQANAFRAMAPSAGLKFDPKHGAWNALKEQLLCALHRSSSGKLSDVPTIADIATFRRLIEMKEGNRGRTFRIAMVKVMVKRGLVSPVLYNELCRAKVVAGVDSFDELEDDEIEKRILRHTFKRLPT